MESKPSKLDRIKTTIEENREVLIAGTSFTVGVVAATLWSIKITELRGNRYPWGSNYKPDRLISDLLMTELMEK